MAFELNPVAVSAEPLLRAIVAGGWVTRSELAEASGRKRGNIARDLTTLEKEGLILQPDEPVGAVLLSDDGIAQLAALDRAAGEGGGDLLPDERLLLHADMEPDPDNPRTDIETDKGQDDIDDLRQSILLKGLLQNLTVRPIPGVDGRGGVARWYVTGGNRRWHAIQQAIFDGDWPEDRPIRVKVRDEDARDSLITAIVENKQRADMHPLDEAEAFHRLREVHGLSTVEICEATGLKPKVVQNRLRLVALDDDARDRMRLPEGHPNRLTYKQALFDLQDHREPGSPRPQPTAELSAALAEQPAPKPFGERITDKEALLLVEVADHVERFPSGVFEGYAPVRQTPVGGAASSLIEKGVIGFRQTGMNAFVTVRPLTSNAGPWLEEIGFHTHRADVLFEMRTRVLGTEKATALATAGEYAADWLNPSPTPTSVGAGLVCRPDPSLTQTEIDDAYVASNALADRIAGDGDAGDDDAFQPHLIEPSADEAEARRAMVQEQNNDRHARQRVADLARLVGDWMAFARFQKRPDHFTDCRAANPEAIATALFAALADGRINEAVAALVALKERSGDMGATHVLARMTPEAIALAAVEGRVRATPETEPEEAA